MSCGSLARNFAMLALAAAFIAPAAATELPVYFFGHSDIEPVLLSGPDRFEIMVQVEEFTEFEGGVTLPEGHTDPTTFAFRVPDDPVPRPSSDEDWGFVGTEADEDVWLLEAAPDPFRDFPYFGFATDSISSAGPWTGGFQWSLREVQLAPQGGEFSLWQSGPDPLFSTVDGVDPSSDAFTRGIGGHDHYNWGFTQPGVYRIILGGKATHATLGEIDGTGTFTFLVGDDTTLDDGNQGGDQPGDFNGDGVVDSADYTVWRDNEGAQEDGVVLGGNGTGIGGLVDSEDYQLWRSAFGTDYGAAALLSDQTIPEPSTVALLVLGQVTLLAIARRAGRRA